MGEIDIKVPRDRKGNYEPKIISKYDRNAEGMEDKVLSLYACGMSQTGLNEGIKSVLFCEVADIGVVVVGDEELRFALVLLVDLAHEIKQDSMLVGVKIGFRIHTFRSLVGRVEEDKATRAGGVGNNILVITVQDDGISHTARIVLTMQLQFLKKHRRKNFNSVINLTKHTRWVNFQKQPPGKGGWDRLSYEVQHLK